MEYFLAFQYTFKVNLTTRSGLEIKQAQFL